MVTSCLLLCDGDFVIVSLIWRQGVSANASQTVPSLESTLVWKNSAWDIFPVLELPFRMLGRRPQTHIYTAVSSTGLMQLC